ncbi:MAG: ribosome maturation factor RimP [Candidatus Calescibacterium sp.]|jgi:ribosome maturation factor RimP|nr:ribosome maturation factor RimP [Candidatus Calescibacterium sp.]
MDFSQIFSFITQKVQSLGFEVYDIQIKDTGKKLVVRVFIDKKDRFIGINDCVFVSRNLEDQLEKMIDRSFILEVSSPGADRELRRDEDFERFKGMTVEVVKRNGGKFIGKLMGKVGDEIFIMIKGKNKISSFKTDEIQKVKLYPDIR